jgi:glycosyltransferase 2 family protein
MLKEISSFLARVGITLFAFWWIFRMVEVESLKEALRSADMSWLLVSLAFFTAAQLAGIIRWALLVPKHAAVTFGFLTNAYFVAAFFNTILPTTVGGDVVRGYDLIKATGEWKNSLASVLMDRLLGVAGFLAFGVAAWVGFPPAREDPVIRIGFYGFCGVVALTFSILGSRKMLQTLLRPFSKIGLGTLHSHAKQFQESLLAYFKQPKRLLPAFGMSLLVQTLAILMFAAVVKAFSLPIPLLFLILAVPIIVTISQLPISLNGWGLREGATILMLQRINIEPAQALSVSLLCGVIPLASGVVGGLLFLARQKRRKKRA